MLSFLGTGGYRFTWNRVQTGPVVTCGYDYLRIGGYRETGDQHKPTMLFNALPGNTSMELGGGVTTLLPYDWQLWVDYESYLFEAQTRRGTVTAGIRKDS